MKECENKKSSLALIFNSSCALFVSKIFMPVSFFAITVSIARLLGTKEFGVYAIVMSYYAVLKIISIFGIDFFLLREIPKNKENVSQYLGNSFVLGGNTIRIT